MRELIYGINHSINCFYSNASASFILATQTKQKALEDEQNVLRAWGFDDYAPKTPLFAESLTSEGTSLLERTCSAGIYIFTIVICFEDLKQIFMAFNCLYRGSGTLIVNLMQRIRTYSKYPDTWNAQYADGASNHLHEVSLNPIFVGISFNMLSYYLYMEFQVILIGINHHLHGNDATRHVIMNPGLDYIISSSDRCFIVASSLSDVNAIGSLVIILIIV